MAGQGAIAAAEKELSIAEKHLAKAQAILGEAILPEKVDVILAVNAFDQAISRATALYTLFGKRFYDIFKIIGQNVIELGPGLAASGSHQ